MPIFDPFASEIITRDAPPRNAMEITASDETDLPVRPTYVWVEGDDSVALRVQMGANVVTLNLPTGSGLSIAPTRIFATGTTASRIILFW